MQNSLFIMLLQKNIVPIIGILIHGFVGILLMFSALYIFEKVTKCNIRKELADRNLSVGLSVSAILLGTALIVMSAIQGRSSNNNNSSPHLSHASSCGQSTSEPQKIKNKK